MGTISFNESFLFKLTYLFAAWEDLITPHPVPAAENEAKQSYHNWRIMLADDDEDDRFLFSQAVRELSPLIQLTSYHDGAELLKFLENATTSLPELIFLDLNMPGKNGFECLETIKQISHLRHIPVIIYSTSASVYQVDESYLKGAHLYVQKPDTFNQIKRTLQTVFMMQPGNFTNRVERKFFQLR